MWGKAVKYKLIIIWAEPRTHDIAIYPHIAASTYTVAPLRKLLRAALGSSTWLKKWSKM